MNRSRAGLQPYSARPEYPNLPTLARLYDADLGRAFTRTMSEIEAGIEADLERTRSVTGTAVPPEAGSDVGSEAGSDVGSEVRE